MRRCVCCMLLICLLFLSLALPAYADDMTEYELEELGMTISLPSNYTVWTQKGRDGRSQEDAGVNDETIMKIMKQTGINLFSIESIATEPRAVVSACDSDVDDYNLLSDAELQLIAAVAEKSSEMTDTEVYVSPATKFIRGRTTDNSGRSVVVYITVCGGRHIEILLHSAVDEIADHDKDTFQDIIDSIRFDPAQPPKGDDGLESGSGAENQDAASYTYTDEVTNASFIVPAGWTVEPRGEQQLFKVKFRPQDASGYSVIMYGWKELPMELSRGGIEIDEMAESLGAVFADSLGDSEVESVTYGDNEYLVISNSSTMLGVTIQSKYVMYCSNKYLYLICFDDQNGGYLQDFESMLASAQFPS